MNSRFGPIRLIALHCGKFDYAEIELDRPLHLVGPNNVGKTSLIALLQFLYLDDQRSMRFSRDMQETRKYYFPSVHSYALFECLTPTGYQTVGVRGCGPIKQYEFDRFSYMGRFDENIFLDANRCVYDFDVIRANLASKGYTPLAPGVLRAALTGVGDGHKVMLGLVPARNRDTYASFKELFCNILRLSHIRQDEMKTLLLSLFARHFQQPHGIDLAKTYRENFEKVKRDTKAVQMIKDLVPDIERALQHRAKRDAARERLPGLYHGVMAAAQDAQNKLQQERATASIRNTRINTELQEADTEESQAREDLLTCTATLTRIKDWLAHTHKLEQTLSDFLPDWCNQRIAEIGKRTDELARRIGNLNDEAIEDVKTRLMQRRKALARLQERLHNVEHACIQTLRKTFSCEQLSDVFRLLNPDLLGLATAGEQVDIDINDIQSAQRSLEHIIGNCKNGVYTGNGMRIELQALDTPSLDAYGDPRNMQAEIGLLEKAIRRDEQLCLDAEEVETLRQEKKLLEIEKLELLRRIEQYEQLLERREKREQQENEQKEAVAQQDKLSDQLTHLKQHGHELTLEQQSLQREQERITQQETYTQSLIADLSRPPDTWGTPPAEQVTGTLEDLAARYKKDFFDQQRQDESLREILNSIEERTYSRYAGADESESLEKLAETCEALPEQEKAAAELWKSIAVGIRTNLQNMGDDLETLRARINRVNRGLASINISNLQSIRLTIVDNPQWTKRIKNIRLQDDMPLFAEKGACDDAFEEIGRLLSERARIELGDLFNLEFEITMPDGSIRKYPHLDRIESNGTTIAIKVLVNLSLLQHLLDGAEVSIPFYLDECSSLDSDNLKAIVQTAQAMGFTAILASPEAMDAATRIYFIREQPNGRVVLDPRNALVERLDDDDQPNGSTDA